MPRLSCCRAINRLAEVSFTKCIDRFRQAKRAVAELARVPSGSRYIDEVLSEAVEGGHPMFRDLTSGIVPLHYSDDINRWAQDWEPMTGHLRIRFSHDGKLVAKEGPITELTAQAAALARLNWHFGVLTPKLCLVVGPGAISEDDCYKYNLCEEDILLGVDKPPLGVLLMERISAEPLAQFFLSASCHKALIRGLEALDRKVRDFLSGLGYVPDCFRLDQGPSNTNIALAEGAFERAAKEGCFRSEDVICFDPAMGYADLTGFGKSIEELHLPWTATAEQ